MATKVKTAADSAGKTDEKEQETQAVAKASPTKKPRARGKKSPASPGGIYAAAHRMPAKVQAPQGIEWLKSFNGASIEVSVAIGNPVVRNLFRRTFYLTAKNLYSLLIYMPAHVSPAQAAKVEKHVSKVQEDLNEHINKHINAATVLIEQNGVRQAQYTPESFLLVVTSPLSHIHLALFQSMDELARILDTLWISNVITSHERSKQLFDCKKRLRDFALRMRSLYVDMQRQIEAKNAPAEDRPAEEGEKTKADSGDGQAKQKAKSGKRPAEDRPVEEGEKTKADSGGGQAKQKAKSGKRSKVVAESEAPAAGTA